MNMKFFYVFVFVFYCVALLAQQSEWQDYLEKKQFEKIILHTDRLQPADSADFAKMYLIGQAYEGLLKYKDAYRFYQHCYSLDSIRTDMLNMLARVAVNLGKTSEAETYFLKVLDSDSDNFFANYQLARLNASLEKFTEAFYYYGFLLENDPENAVILRAVGDCFSRLNELDTALEFYWEAHKANIENASLASLLINTLLKQHNPINNYVNEALQVCDTALFYNQGNITLRQNKAMAYYVKNDYRKADTLYTSLLADRDSSYITLKYCGFARYYSQYWFNAIEPLEKAFTMDSTAVDVCILLGNCIGKTYDPNRALTYFDKAERLMEPSPFWVEKITQFRADAYLRKGDCNKGAELYYQLWAKDEEKTSYLQQIQRCYASRPDNMSDEERQRYLFITYFLASEILKKPATPELSKELSYLLSVLKKFEEEMFFRSIESFPIITPDNRKNTLSKEKLKELTAKLANN